MDNKKKLIVTLTIALLLFPIAYIVYKTSHIPDLQKEQTDTNKDSVAFYINQGLEYYNSGNYDKSIETWDKILNIDPKSATALNNIGSAFMMKNQYNDAIVLFKKALELEPDNQLAKNNLAWALDEKSKTEGLLKK